MLRNRRENETPAATDLDAITVITDTIVADMTKVVHVLARKADVTIDRRQERNGRIGRGRHHAGRNLTETGRRWDPGHQNRAGLEIDMIAIDKDCHIGQLLSIAKYSHGIYRSFKQTIVRQESITRDSHQQSRYISHQGRCFRALTFAFGKRKAQLFCQASRREATNHLRWAQAARGQEPSSLIKMEGGHLDSTLRTIIHIIHVEIEGESSL